MFNVWKWQVGYTNPNDHIFIYTQTMVALEFSMHSFPFAMDFKTFTETSF
jgi:hypothetical protein